jgi:transcriptional regulator with XRE-family HTH domain
MIDVNLKGVHDHLADIAHRAREKRLTLNVTQSELALRSGVSLASLKRFESTGRIAFASLLHIALVLGNLADFEHLFRKGRPVDLFAPEPKKRLRGSGRKKA